MPAAAPIRDWVRLGLIAASFAVAGVAAAAAPPDRPAPGAGGSTTAAIEKLRASAETTRVLKWISETGDNLDLPFIVIDKGNAKVFAFNADGTLRGSAPALLGLGRGDRSTAGIGQRRLADIKPSERTTPAGRFIASIGNDLGEANILWVDYENAISLHRVITGGKKDRRLQRLASPSTDDNRISFGCINVPVEFFESVVLPLFDGTNGIVYVLPESTPLHEVFNLPAGFAVLPGTADAPVLRSNKSR